MKKIKWDKFGHCVKCHKSLLTEKVITQPDGKPAVKLVFTKDREETRFELDDGSQMRVCICKDCKDKLATKDHKPIMQSVIKGWEHEIDELGTWDTKRKKDYMKKYSKRKIMRKMEVSKHGTYH